MEKYTVLFLVVASACGVRGQAYHYPDHEFDKTPLGEAVDKASMKFLREAYTAAEDKNVIASPLGVLMLLSLYSAGADGPIKDEIIQALGAKDYEELFSSYTSLSQRMSAMDASYLTLANKVYVANQYELSDNFTDTAVRSYKSEVERIDFGNAKEAAATINKWADEKTNGHIKDPVAEDALDGNVAAALCNVIFFQGHWNVPFNASDTVDKDFHVDKSTTVQKPTMRLAQSLFYYDSTSLGAKMIELPYKEQGFRMVVVLPNEIDGLPSVLEKVAQNGVLSDVFSLEPAGRGVILEIPKFDIKNKFDLNNLLPKIGVSKLFDQPATGILKAQPVKVSKAFQEAFVKVDEEGATAGAFTGFIAVTYSSVSRPPPPLEFKADHPFLFLILHEETVMFAGTFTH